MSDVEISRTLVELDRKCNMPGVDPEDILLYSKLAVLELCGWIEEVVDSIAISCCSSALQPDEIRKYIKRVNGMKYADHVRSILITCIGLNRVQILEDNIKSSGSYNILESNLNYLSIRRNDAAHTNITNAREIYETPSVIYGRFESIRDALMELEGELKKLI